MLMNGCNLNRPSFKIIVGSVGGGFLKKKLSGPRVFRYSQNPDVWAMRFTDESRTKYVLRRIGGFILAGY